MQKPDNLTMYSDFDEPVLRKLEIPALALDYGRYRIELNITMYNETIWHNDSVHVHIGQ